MEGLFEFLLLCRPYLPYSWIFLVALAVWGWVTSGGPLLWCQDQWHAKSNGNWEEAPLEPNPIKDRAEWLHKNIDTPLMEGDVGAFILRRAEITHEHTAAYFANLLVSLALFFTVVGLMFTMRELSLAVKVSPDIRSTPSPSTASPAPSPAVNASPDMNPTPLPSGASPAPSPSATLPPDLKPTAVVETIMRQVQEPLSRIPGLFFPTGVGLLLAVFLTWRQRRVDQSLESTWSMLDQYTQSTLLPEALSKRTSTDETTTIAALQTIASGLQSLTTGLRGDLTNLVGTVSSSIDGTLNKVAQQIDTGLNKVVERMDGRLGEISTALQQTLSGLSDAVTQFGKLDQSEWATKLISAADAFSAQVCKGANQLEGSAVMIAASLESFKGASDGITEITTRLGAAAVLLSELSGQIASVSEKNAAQLESLGNIATQLGDVQDRILGLGRDFEAMATNTRSLNDGFTDWNSKHGLQLADLTSLIKNLSEIIRPLMEQRTTEVEQFKANVETSQRTLVASENSLKGLTDQVASLLKNQKQYLEAIPRDVEKVLREGLHQFLAETASRYDQGEGLYDRIDKLCDALHTEADKVETTGDRVSELANQLPPFLGRLDDALSELANASTNVASVSDSLERRADQAADGTNRLEASLSNLTSSASSIEPAITNLSEKLLARMDLPDPKEAHLDDIKSVLADLKARLASPPPPPTVSVDLEPLVTQLTVHQSSMEAALDSQVTLQRELLKSLGTIADVRPGGSSSALTTLDRAGNNGHKHTTLRWAWLWRWARRSAVGETAPTEENS